MVREMSLREEFFKAYLGALCQLKCLTPGLSKIASEEAARAVLEKFGLKAEGGWRDALDRLYAAFGVEASVEAEGEEIRVAVRHPCPLSWPGCESLCPLPHISSAHLSTLGRWFPKRVGAAFVEVSQEACRFTLVQPLRVIEGANG
ncbi:MAG: hypothetical protein QXF90_05680 [Thermofilaceae archaeon]